MTGQIQEIDLATSAIATVAASVSGVDAAPAFSIFNVRDNIIALVYPMTSETIISELGTMQDLAMIACDVLTPFVDALNTDYQGILVIAKNIKKAFVREVSNHSDGSAGTFFNNTISAVTTCRLEFLPYYVYGNTQYIGYRVSLEDVKLKYDL
jgi:hypothetical protein